MKVYSVWDIIIVNFDDEENPTYNQLFTDGVNTPSEFTGNCHDLGDMVSSWYLPRCTDCMSCGYCSYSNEGCNGVSTIPVYSGYYDTLMTPPTIEE